METAIAVLLISALTTTGLLALLAATSRRHWFLRTAAFLGAISPLLLVPAYEPFVALALQGAVVAGGMTVAEALSRKRRERSEGVETTDAGHPWRFSMATLLLAMVLCGVAAAIAAQMPAFNRQVWQSLVLIGGCGGAATLVGYWAATRVGRGRRIAAFAAACAAGIVIGLAPAWLDWFVPSLMSEAQWPPEQSDLDALAQGLRPVTPTIIWNVATVAVAATSFVVVWLISIIIVSTSPTLADRNRRLWNGGAALSILVIVSLVAAPSVYVLGQLLTPNPVPIATLPEPNGFDDFVAAGQMVDAMNASAGNAEVAKAIERGRLGLARHSVVPVDYANDETSFHHVLLVRNLMRLIDGEGQRAKMNGAYDESVAAHLDNIRLGTASRRGGLILDGLVGVAVTGVGASGLFNIREDLTPAQCVAAIQQLTALEAAREPYAALEARDRVWVQRVLGWYGHVYQILGDSAGAFGADSRKPTFNGEAAVQRLLIAHLTLQAYRAEYGRWPRTWDEVTAAGLPALMADPWDPDGGPLQYRLNGDDVALYSVGSNGVDDGGVTPGWDEMSFNASSGDFRIDVFYGPRPGAVESDDGDEEGDAAADDE